MAGARRGGHEQGSAPLRTEEIYGPQRQAVRDGVMGGMAIVVVIMMGVVMVTVVMLVVVAVVEVETTYNT